MAWVEKKDTNGEVYYQTDATGAGTFEFKNAFNGAVNTFCVHVNKQSSTTMSFVFKGKRRRILVSLFPYESLPYQYSQDATAIDKLAGVAATASGIYFVRGDGMDVELVMSANDVAGDTGPIFTIEPMLG